MRKGGKSVSNEFYCTQCGNKGIPAARRDFHLREAGHLKKMFCLNCQKETNHVECSESGKYTADMFRKEFADNNFDINGQRKVELGDWLGKA